MGIPSYYKKLIESDPNLIQSLTPGVDWLFMDYNCLIYYCLHSPTLRPYHISMNANERVEWEKDLIGEIVAYTLSIIRTVKPTRGVYLAIDGVVPMAKMRQQRLRRFKSSWMAEKGWSERPVSWDTNAITPGTTFMKQLREGLEKMIRSQRKQKTWELSSSDEPGEGEHKILTKWRSGNYKGRMAVYGMDADLIVLTLLCSESISDITDVWLFREKEDQLQEFEWFSIGELRRILCQMGQGVYDNDSDWILTYGCAMSLLGNDFLPRSMSLTLREEGHADLISHIRSLTTPLLHKENMALCAEGWIELFSRLAETEEERIHDTVQRKRRNAQNADLVEMGQRNWPLSRYEEEHVLISCQPPYSLKRDWKEIYATAFFPGWGTSDVSSICHEYVSGLQWIWSYYMTDKDAVCYNWYYPHTLPPLWSWLAQMTPDTIYHAWDTRMTQFVLRASDIRPVEQLTLVLPPSSWQLIPSEESVLREFPLRAPYYFPTEFGLDSVGKRFFWECEPKIPIPSMAELKQVLTF